MEPAEKLEFRHIETPNVEQALPAALGARDDYRSLMSQQQSLIEQEKASHARYLPTLEVKWKLWRGRPQFRRDAGDGRNRRSSLVTIFDRDRNGREAGTRQPR